MKQKFIILSQVLFVFLLCYLGPNYLATLRPHHYKLYFDFELAAPLIPWAIIPYCSVYLSPIILFFKSEINYVYRVRFALITQTLIALFFFLLFPAELGFTRVIPQGFFAPWYNSLFAVDMPHNLLPSLHVGYAFEWAMGIREIYARWAPVIWIWYFLVCFSVVATHQHHILDIATGLPLAFFTHRWAKKRYQK